MNLKTPVIFDIYEGEYPVKIEQMDPKPFGIVVRGSWQGLGNRTRAADTRALEYIAKIRDAGIRDGMYHFLTPNGIAEQAALFLSQWNKVKGTVMEPIVDVEVDLPRYYTGTATIGQAVWQGHVKLFLDMIEAGTGKRPMIYTNKNYWGFVMTKNAVGQLVPPTWTANYPLWVAPYPTYPDEATAPAILPNGWTRWAMWQYNDKGRTNGFLANDLNIPSDWYAAELAGVTVPPPDPDPEPDPDPDPEPTPVTVDLALTVTGADVATVKVNGTPYVKV